MQVTVPSGEQGLSKSIQMQVLSTDGISTVGAVETVRINLTPTANLGYAVVIFLVVVASAGVGIGAIKSRK